MNIKNVNESLIAYFVEKISKGVKKQLKGFTTQIREEIELERRKIHYDSKNFEDSLIQAKNMRKDFLAIQMMIEETKRNKELLAEMRLSYEEMKNEFMDIQLALIEEHQKKEIERRMKVNE